MMLTTRLSLQWILIGPCKQPKRWSPKIYLGETQVKSGERGKSYSHWPVTDVIQQQILHLEKIVLSSLTFVTIAILINCLSLEAWQQLQQHGG